MGRVCGIWRPFVREVGTLPAMMDPALLRFAELHGVDVEALAELLKAVQTIPDLDSRPSNPTHETWAPAGQTPAPVGRRVVRAPLRYEDRGPLGRGGMGEVRRVYDTELRRTVAMKTLKDSLAVQTPAMERFLEEAQTSAQLQHPGIIPVHDLGRLPDGTVYFTMQEIRGITLASCIGALHREASDSASLHRLIDIFRQVCDAVGYAHRRGVVHRDIKPSNVMVGEDGEVLVVDWGIALLTRPEPGTDPVDTDTSFSESSHSIAGTPKFMAPEQAEGRADARSDVWSLGAVLYDILCGAAPYSGEPLLVLAQLTNQTPIPTPASRTERKVPDVLAKIAMRALAHDREDRFPNAVELGNAVASWLEGEGRRTRSEELVEEARGLVVRSDALEAEVVALRGRAAGLLEGVAGWAPESAKQPAWALQDRANHIARQAQLAGLEAETRLHSALSYYDTEDAHLALAARFRHQHERAVEERDDDGQTRAEVFLQAEINALSEGTTRAGFARYLEGLGALTLHTDPPGVEAILSRYVLQNRRLVPERVRALGPTPLVELPIEAGSYVITLLHPDFEPVRYPVLIERLTHWDGVPPEQSHPAPIRLPRRGSLGANEIFVPAGWFIAGGDEAAMGSLPRTRLWADSFVVDRYSATNRVWMHWLDTLAKGGRGEDAWRWCPRDDRGQAGGESEPIYGHDGTRFQLVPDLDGDLWDPEWPVCMIDLVSSLGWAQWRSEQTGQPWRLLSEWEWEKAARGVDGRCFPWGDQFDPSWCMMRDSLETVALAKVDDFPVDESPYGVRGTAGNIATYCLESFVEKTEPPGPRLVIPPQGRGARQIGRGGMWMSPPTHCRTASRGFTSPTRTLYSQGVRLARSIDSPTAK